MFTVSAPHHPILPVRTTPLQGLGLGLQQGLR